MNKPQNQTLIIYLLTAIQFAHIVDFVIMMPLGPMFMRDFHIAPAQFALLVSLYNISAAFFGFLVGLTADKYDRKKFLVFMFCGFIIGTLICALSHTYSVLAAGRIIAGAFGGIVNAIIFTIIAELISPDYRGKATGLVMSSFSLASTAGVPLGLIVANKFGWPSAFISIVISSIIILIITLKILPDMPAHQNAKNENLSDLLSHYWSMMTKRRYIEGYIFIGLLSFAAFILIPFISPYAVKNLSIQENDLKYIYLIGGFFTIFSARLIGGLSDKVGHFKMLWITALISFLPIYLYTHLKTDQFYVIIATTTLFMSLVSGRFIPAMSLISSIPSPTDRGRYMSLLNAFRSLCTAIAALVGGLIITQSQTGSLEHYDHVGLISIAAAILSLFLAKKIYTQLS